MIESVQARQLGSKDFLTIYNQLCTLQDSCPLTSVKAHLKEGFLELNVDRIRLADWPPILGALRINKTLRKVSLKGYYQKPAKQDGKLSSKRLVQKAPPIYSKDVTYKMCTAIKECLQTTEALTALTVQGIPLRCYDMQNLSKGLYAATTIQHLSFEYCRLSHRTIELLCKGIQSSPCLKSINLTGCGVTAKGAEALARLIKHQSTTRHSEAWKDSLRYRRPNLDQMPGLRRITLNNNPLLNDAGALYLADALKDDLWLKALDMQHCGVSNVGASAILEALRGNSTIVVLDLRRNPLMDHDVLKDVIEQVLINADGCEEDEYPWRVAASSMEPPAKPLRSKRKCKMKKKEGKSSPAAGAAQMKSSVTVHKESKPVTKPGPGFIPWRSAARAEERQRSATSLPNQEQAIKTQISSEPKKSGSVVHVHRTPRKTRDPTETNAVSSVLVEESLSSDSEEDTATKDETTSSSSLQQREKEMKELMVRLEEIERRLDLETKARKAADSRVVELTMENSRLKRHLEILGGRHPVTTNGRRQNGAPVEGFDDDLLKTIEESFKKFHSFLDLLRDAGLGQLCSLVGLTPSELHNPAVATILQNHQPSGSVSPVSDSQQPRINGFSTHPSDVHPHVKQSIPHYNSQDNASHMHPQASSSQPVTTTNGSHPSVSSFQPSSRSLQQAVHGLQPAVGGSHKVDLSSGKQSSGVISHVDGLLPVGHISVSAPTAVTSIASSGDATIPSRHGDYHKAPGDARTASGYHDQRTSLTESALNSHKLATTATSHHAQSQMTREHFSTRSGTEPISQRDNDKQKFPTQAAVSSNLQSVPMTTHQHPRTDLTYHHHINSPRGTPPPGVTTRISYLAATGHATSNPPEHQGQSTDRVDETVPTDAPLTAPDDGRQHSLAGFPPNSQEAAGRMKEDLGRKIKLVTVEEKDGGDGPERDGTNRNNNSNVFLEEMSERHYGARDLITPDHLRESRRMSDNASFHALQAQDATMPAVVEPVRDAEHVTDSKAGYSDDEFDVSSGSSGHSGIRTSTPERTLSERSKEGATFDKSGELLSNVEEGEIESLTEMSSPVQAAIHGDDSH